MSQQERIPKQIKKFIIVPFRAVAGNCIFRAKKEWFIKRNQADRNGNWGPLGLSLDRDCLVYFSKDELVATFHKSVYTTEYKNKAESFYA